MGTVNFHAVKTGLLGANACQDIVFCGLLRLGGCQGACTGFFRVVKSADWRAIDQDLGRTPAGMM